MRYRDHESLLDFIGAATRVLSAVLALTANCDSSAEFLPSVGMESQFETRRYLTNFDSNRASNIVTDVLVIGTGVAGARAAIEAAKFGNVVLTCKASFDESNTRYAQGGIASVLDPRDSEASHFEDTTRVGCGLTRERAVRLLVREGPASLREVFDWGLAVDRERGEIALGREGGHSFNRIVHARGDQTGLELSQTLERQVRSTPNIRVFEHCFVIDMLTCEGHCVGVVTYHERHGHQLIWAKQVVLASGGCGRIWRETTNPAVATGDGPAAAFRAGAALGDMEMVQFHPTTLYVAGAARALISEAVRGEGGLLVDRHGHRFMTEYHPDGELAPRDVVSRAIHDHLTRTRSNCVFLDVRHLSGFVGRFPFIAGLCRDFQIDVQRDRVPVRPSAHYMIGGVVSELDGSTSIPGLLCCGEAACSGVHGANRLASNSLLEGLVFGRLAGETAGRRARDVAGNATVRRLSSQTPDSQRTELDLTDIRNSLRSLMWRNVGIVRHEDRLRETGDILGFWSHYTFDKTFDDVEGWELQNQLTVAHLVASSALERRDSIGVHFRDDRQPESATRYHLRVQREIGGAQPERVEDLWGLERAETT